METNSSGDELLKTSSKETNCLETKSRGTKFQDLYNPIYFSHDYSKQYYSISLENKTQTLYIIYDNILLLPLTLYSIQHTLF